MQPDALAPLIPIAAIIMFGLVQISKHWRGQPPNRAASKQLEERLAVVEEQLATLQAELGDAHERLDFAERVLAQTQDAKRLPPQ
jgi:DNA-binding transcriptional MerR regulator